MHKNEKEKENKESLDSCIFFFTKSAKIKYFFLFVPHKIYFLVAKLV